MAQTEISSFSSAAVASAVQAPVWQPQPCHSLLMHPGEAPGMPSGSGNGHNTRLFIPFSGKPWEKCAESMQGGITASLRPSIFTLGTTRI